MNNEHIERHNEEIRREALAGLKPIIAELADAVQQLTLAVLGPEPESKPEKKASAPRTRKRTRTVASEEQMAKVWQAIADAQPGATPTITDLGDLVKLGRTTVSKACAVLVERGQIEKAGKGYRLIENKAEGQKPLNNGEASEEAGTAA